MPRNIFHIINRVFKKAAVPQPERTEPASYIEVNPAKCFGMPSLVGRRLTVFDIVTIVDGIGLELAMEDYEVSYEQVIEALVYCSGRRCKENKNDFQFCDGCILRDIEDGTVFDEEDYYEIYHPDGQITTRSKDGLLLFKGSIAALKEEEAGKPVWETATRLLHKIS